MKRNVCLLLGTLIGFLAIISVAPLSAVKQKVRPYIDGFFKESPHQPTRQLKTDLPKSRPVWDNDSCM